MRREHYPSDIVVCLNSERDSDELAFIRSTLICKGCLKDVSSCWVLILWVTTDFYGSFGTGKEH